MAAYGLYTHIASNKTRSIVLLIGLFLLIYVIVFAGAIFLEVFMRQDRSVDYYLSAAWSDLKVAFPYATVAALIWIVIAYFFNQAIIDAVTGGHEVTRKEQPRLYNLLENLCISRGIPMPKLKVMDTDALNAFASGLNQRQYSVTVTSGLLRGLNDEELEAVLGHELTHIRNGDVQMMVIAVIIAGVVGLAAEIFIFVLGQRQEGRRWRDHRHPCRRGADLPRLVPVAGRALRAVSLARVPGRRGRGGTDQKPGRNDLGPAQDRESRRARRRDFRRDGDVHRQSARGFRRSVRDPSLCRRPRPRAGEVRRRSRFRPPRSHRGPGNRPFRRT
jgi:hypothetical protein